MATRNFEKAPASLPLMLKAALPAIPVIGGLPGIRHTMGKVPDLVLTRNGVKTDPEHLEQYIVVCSFARSDTLPVTYPHLAAFGLHMTLMTDTSFPFAPMGLVHLRNTINQHRPIGIDEALDVAVHAEALRRHPKGQLIDIVTTVTIDGELAWDETMTLFSRGHPPQAGGASGSKETAKAPLDGVKAPVGVVHWKTKSDLGRRYGAVSGDRNPIHLYPITAKAFGFRSNIAHGMWTKARCLAALQNRLPDSYRVDVEFKKPVLLPNTVIFGADETDSGYVFGVTGGKNSVTHVVGQIVAAT